MQMECSLWNDEEKFFIRQQILYLFKISFIYYCGAKHRSQEQSFLLQNRLFSCLCSRTALDEG